MCLSTTTPRSVKSGKLFEYEEKHRHTVLFLLMRDPHELFIYFLNKERQQVSLVNKFVQKECIDRHKAWILKLSIGKTVSKFMKVCSLHFAEEDYFYRCSSSSAACPAAGDTRITPKQTRRTLVQNDNLASDNLLSEN
ncbi:hypothetical protein NQ318_007199 [Aromia moschata]|uniref:THAP-type domain-containing protein n=1 Tax=Aromia moschata TaxID=1265417 RepID=A0AAV8X941_9CUCU|nr:hypothetical protein NQ318_007199 [Aromia moschata]